MAGCAAGSTWARQLPLEGDRWASDRREGTLNPPGEVEEEANSDCQSKGVGKVCCAGGGSTHVEVEFSPANRKRSTNCAEIISRLDSSYLAHPLQRRAAA